jgi:hypothetical protein
MHAKLCPLLPHATGVLSAGTSYYDDREEVTGYYRNERHDKASHYDEYYVSKVTESLV